MTKWLLRCTRCGRTWVLEVSFDLTKLSRGTLYHYCPHCKQNTFHEIVKRIEEEEELSSVASHTGGDDEKRGAEKVRKPVSAEQE